MKLLKNKSEALAGCLNKFEKPKQDTSFKKSELVMLLRLSLFLRQFETLKLFIKSLIFCANIDLPQELKSLQPPWIYVRMVHNTDVFSFASFDPYIVQSFTFLLQIIPTRYNVLNDYFIMFLFQTFCSSNYSFRYCFRCVF